MVKQAKGAVQLRTFEKCLYLHRCFYFGNGKTTS